MILSIYEESSLSSFIYHPLFLFMIHLFSETPLLAPSMGGCGTKLQAPLGSVETMYETKYRKLVKEHRELVRSFEARTLSSAVDESGDIATHEEAINLLRYRVDLLMTMLAISEKGKETLQGRVDTLKQLILTQGASEQQLAEMLAQQTGASGETLLDISFDLDLASAFDHMRISFQTSQFEIVRSLSDPTGVLQPVLPKDEFIERLAGSTELPRRDLAALSLRFFDGEGGVLVGEFLAFFSSAPRMRQAAAAEQTVRLREEYTDIAALAQSPYCRSPTARLEVVIHRSSTLLHPCHFPGGRSSRDGAAVPHIPLL
jgi:hypothetical protein